MNFFSSLIQNPCRLLRLSTRAYSSESPEGIQYFGFTYYPRNKNFKDPPYTPSKLFLVKRLKGMRGLNPQEKKALKLLNIDGFKKTRSHISVVKNIPEINALLWTVKHLVDIKPISWSGELPKEFPGAYLRETGELIISPKFKVSEKVLNATENYVNSEVRLKTDYIKSYLLKKWEMGEYN